MSLGVAVTVMVVPSVAVVGSTLTVPLAIPDATLTLNVVGMTCSMMSFADLGKICFVSLVALT